MINLKHRLKLLFLVLLLPLYAVSASLPEKYPSYAYVFSEFSVDESYIYNESFEKFVLKNEKKIRTFYTRSIERGDYLLPLVKNHLMDDGLSDLLIYISMIESGFTSDIVSSKKAVGLWQFMPATAKHYKLEVCNGLDERCDPESSTKAAIAYLRKLHKQFGKWYLAVMAYNCGEGCLSKAIKKAGSDDLSILIDDHDKYLPKETRKYIKKILLVAMIGEAEILDFQVKEKTLAPDLFQVEVKGGTKLLDIALLLEMKLSALQKLNRQFKNALIPNEKARYSIIIPEEKMMLFYMKYEIEEEKKKCVKPHLVSYYVVMGDTLETVAKKFNSSAGEIKVVNKLKEDALTLDLLLLIPVSEALFEEALK